LNYEKNTHEKLISVRKVYLSAANQYLGFTKLQAI
jgi:hypothetical protein